MKHLITLGLGVTALLAVYAQPQAQTGGDYIPITGATMGQVSGLVENNSGAMVSPRAAVQATIFAQEYPDGNVIATVSGTAACAGDLGLSFDFNAEYNAATGAFTGVYSDTPGVAPDKAIVFNNTEGLKWQAAISGQAASPNGLKSYDLVIDVEVPESAVFIAERIPDNLVYGGNLNRTESVIIPVKVPSIGLDQTLTMGIDLTGQWSAVAVPQPDGSQTFTGKATGTFKASEPAKLTFSVPVIGNQTINVDFTGGFGGTLFYLNDEEVAFQGSWVTQAAGQAFGGDISVNIEFADITRFPYTIEGTLAVETGFSQMPVIQVPFSVSGEFPLDLTASP